MASLVRVVAYRDGVGTNQSAGAFDVGDVATFQESGETLVQTRDDTFFVGVDGRHINAVKGALDAELRALTCGVRDLGRMQQRFGRDATFMKAGATELALVDQNDVETELGCTQRAGVSAAAATEDDDVLDGAPGLLGLALL